MKLKKTKKSAKHRGETTHGHGARKKWKKSGHKGGCGMAGTGKRGDQKKTLINKLYGNKYFGKQGITSKGTARKKNNVMNLGFIESNLGNLKKKHEKQGVLDLSKYKILGEGELKSKLKIKAKEVSKSAKEKIEKAGGEVVEILVKTKKSKEGQASKPEQVGESNTDSKDVEVNQKKPDDTIKASKDKQS